jgi:hypothetical protein
MKSLDFSEKIPVIDNPDVLVIGGGPAGIGAALSAARLGMKVTIIEQTNALGGIATSGLHGHICSYAAAGRINERVVGGICHEFAEVTVKRGFGAYKGESSFDFEVEGFKLILEEMSQEAGITIYYYTQFSDVVVENGQIKYLIIQSKNGRQAFAPQMVIDCTGDADVAAKAGVPCDKGRAKDGATQPMTLMFQLGGVDNERVNKFRYHKYKGKYNAEDTYKLSKVWKEAQANGDMEPFQDGIMGWWFTPTRPDQLGINFTHIFGRDCTSTEDLTYATIEGRRQAYHTAEVYRKYIPGMENCWVSHCAALIGTRESRRIHGLYTITEQDLMAQKDFDDSIGYGSFFIDVHNCTGPGMDHETWHPPTGFKYQIPLRALIPENISNLLVAGRCISCTHIALGSLRVMPQCVLEGEACGVTATLAIEKNLANCDVDYKRVQQVLKAQKAIVTAEDIVHT